MSNPPSAAHPAPAQAKSTASTSHRPRVSWIAAGLIAVAALGGGAYYLIHSRHAQAASADAEDKDAAPAPVSVETVHLTPGGIVRTSSQIGTVHPYQDADLYAKVSGYLETLHVDYGDKVKRGQVLATIDDPEVVEDAKRAAADLELVRAAVVQAQAVVETAKADRDAAGTGVEQASAEVKRYVSMQEYHSKKYARYRELVKSKAIPQEIADEEEESYESARASEVASEKAVLNARAQLVAAEAKIKKAEADVTGAKANVNVSEARLARARAMAAYTTITSPYDGIVTRRNFFRGAFIRSASEGGTIPILSVARTDKVRVVTQIPDRDVTFTDIGDPAEVTLDALGGEAFKGTVSRFAGAEDPTSRTMHTEIDLDNPGLRIKPGMYGIARITLDHSVKSSTLPASCLVGESKGGKADVLVARGGKAVKVPVAVGADDGLRVEIRSGLDPKDDVIRDTGSISDGTPVRVVEAATKDAGPKAPPEATGHAAR